MKNLGMLILLCLVLGTVGVYSHVYKELRAGPANLDSSLSGFSA